MSTDPGAPPPPDADALTDEELRAAYEAELARIRVDDVLIQTVVSLLNLAARRAGLTGAADGEEPDFEQVRLAIEATRALLPLVEPVLGPDAKQVRDALSQLQLAYARSGAKPPPGAAVRARRGRSGRCHGRSKAPPKPGDPDSAVSSGRLWVPGPASRPRRRAAAARPGARARPLALAARLSAARVTLRARSSRPGGSLAAAVG